MQLAFIPFEVHGKFLSSLTLYRTSSRFSDRSQIISPILCTKTLPLTKWTAHLQNRRLSEQRKRYGAIVMNALLFWRVIQSELRIYHVGPHVCVSLGDFHLFWPGVGTYTEGSTTGHLDTGFLCFTLSPSKCCHCSETSKLLLCE